MAVSLGGIALLDRGGYRYRLGLIFIVLFSGERLNFLVVRATSRSLMGLCLCPSQLRFHILPIHCVC